MEAKVCTKCKENKSLDSFPKNNKVSDGYSSWCKYCHSSAVLRLYKPRPKRKTKKQIKEDLKQFYINNINYKNPITQDIPTLDNFSTHRKINCWRIIDGTIYWNLAKPRPIKPKLFCYKNCGNIVHRINSKCKLCIKTEKLQMKLLRQKESNIRKRVRRNLRKSLKKVIKRHIKANFGILGNFGNMIECTGSQLIKHIESTWLPGMSWDNYGINGWHIDHIRPIIDFIRKGDNPRKANHYSNLQALWAKDNIAKRDKI